MHVQPDSGILRLRSVFYGQNKFDKNLWINRWKVFPGCWEWIWEIKNVLWLHGNVWNVEIQCGDSTIALCLVSWINLCDKKLFCSCLANAFVVPVLMLCTVQFLQWDSRINEFRFWLNDLSFQAMTFCVSWVEFWVNFLSTNFIPYNFIFIFF